MAKQVAMSTQVNEMLDVILQKRNEGGLVHVAKKTVIAELIHKEYKKVAKNEQ